MPYLLTGCVSFLFFVVYDINSISLKSKLLHKSFAVGCMLLAASTAGLIAVSDPKNNFDLLRTGFFSILALVFLILLVYTLFFALPFHDTYIYGDKEEKSAPSACQSGVYALCRHPGVIWFVGFYFSLWLMIPDSLLLSAAVIFSILNIAYVVFQDKWTFMRSFSDYSQYKKNTPFLIPTFQSITRRKCRPPL